MKYWLFKSEPSTYAWDELVEEGQDYWEGIRNYQARNFLRDEVKVGDLVLFYHSVVRPPCVVGVARVVKEGYPDHYAFDEKHQYYDPKSDPENPRWYMVDIEPVMGIEEPITLAEIKDNDKLSDMVLVNNSRLSIQPVKEKEFKTVLKMRKIPFKMVVDKAKTKKKTGGKTNKKGKASSASKTKKKKGKKKK